MVGVRLARGGDITAGLEDEIADIVTSAMRDTTADVKEAFRAQVRAAGLGEKLASAVRGVAYPSARSSLEPAGWIYAQPSRDGRGAAAIIESYASGAMITPRAGKRWLAVPTDDCPRKRQGNAMNWSRRPNTRSSVPTIAGSRAPAVDTRGWPTSS